MTASFKPSPLESLLLRKEERADLDALSASIRALDDGDFLSLMAMAWGQLGWVLCLGLTASPLILIPMAIDAALFALRWRMRHRKTAIDGPKAPQVRTRLLSIFLIHSLLVTAQIAFLARSEFDAVVMLAIILCVGFCGYVVALQSVFLRLAALNIVLLTLALMIGFATGLSDTARPLAVLVPMGTVAYIALVRRVHATIQGAIRNQIASERLSLHDPLTKLPNRTFMAERLAHVLSELGAAGGPKCVAVACLDLDGFKEVNDRNGHSAGDWTLIHVAAILSARTAGDGLASRLGGDEFVLILPGYDAEGVQRIGRDIIADISKPFDIGTGLRVAVGASIGATIAVDRDDDPLAVLERADSALYDAKRSGKGIVQLHGAGPDIARARGGHLRIAV